VYAFFIKPEQTKAEISKMTTYSTPELETLLDFAVAKLERDLRLCRNFNLYYDNDTNAPGRVLVGGRVDVYVERTQTCYRACLTHRGADSSVTSEWVDCATVASLLDYVRGELRSMRATQDLPAIAMPATPKAKRIDETKADPYWLAAMESLRKSFCVLVLLCGLAGTARADGPALAVDTPAWSFVVPTDAEPSAPVDEFLSALESAPLEAAVERASAAEPFEVDTQIAESDVAAMIAEGEAVQ
jgi:hypothetical protein